MLYVGQGAVYEEGSELLAELVGVEVSGKQIERLCHYFGELLGEREEPESSLPGEDAVYGMVDGSMILTREEGWKEIKLGRLFSASDHEKGPEDQRGRIGASVYTAHIGSYRSFLSKWECELASISKDRLVFLADGAQWFWEWASEQYPESLQILDYYHCKGYLCSFAKVYFKDQKERARWIKEQEESLFADRIEEVIEGIEGLARRGVEDLIERRKILGYYRNNRTRMYYGSYRKKGLMIGSGPIEAAHRNVIQQRLKLAGQRWTKEGAQQLANIRVMRKSDRWDNVIELTRARKRAA